MKKIGNAHIFQAVLTRKAVHRQLIGDLLNLFGGSADPVVSHLVETGKLTLNDVRELEKRLSAMEKE
ncbi:MAG TPA: BlaI/MecI/CopY family transcriptional regulator [Bryobacteraceae bacterium]